MLTAWRLVKTKHLPQAFDGVGAWRVGGRWNNRGTAILYCSDSIALATLEILSHLQSVAPLPAYSVIPVQFDDELVEEIDASALPDNWKVFPAPSDTRRIGDDWVKHGATPVLRVPSVVVPRQYNYLINPSHDAFGQIVIGDPTTFEFDPRLLSKT